MEPPVEPQVTPRHTPELGEEMMVEWRQLFAEEILDLPECYVGHDERLLHGDEPPHILVDVAFRHIGKRQRRHDEVHASLERTAKNTQVALQAQRLRYWHLGGLG